MKLSIVTTLYHSEEYIRDFHSRATAAARDLFADSFEIVFVNDGSPDDSLASAIALAKHDSRLVVIDLSRNFGHHKAMMTGLSYARGDRIFLIDSDLEESPEWLGEFQDRLVSDNADMVYGVQVKRRGKWAERVTGWMFYKLFRLLTGVSQPDNKSTARLMSRRYVDALLLHQEREVNIGGLWIITGFKQIAVDVKKLSNSATTYTLGGKISHFVNAITSFSSLPLVFVFYIGLLATISALGFSALLVSRYLLYAAAPDGYTSLIASIWFFSGLIILFLGIQGIYIAKIFSEVKQRPNTIVRKVYQHKPDEMG
jgi:putative glycosyltransferase